MMLKLENTIPTRAEAVKGLFRRENLRFLTDIALFYVGSLGIPPLVKTDSPEISAIIGMTAGVLFSLGPSLAVKLVNLDRLERAKNLPSGVVSPDIENDSSLIWALWQALRYGRKTNLSHVIIDPETQARF